MGNTDPSNSKLKVHIDTENDFYNSGSVINGTVFVNALDNFQFDALYIRVEGTSILTQEISTASGSKALPRTGGSSPATRTSTPRRKCCRGSTAGSRPASTCTLSLSRSPRTSPVLTYRPNTMPASSISWWHISLTSRTTKSDTTSRFLW